MLQYVHFDDKLAPDMSFLEDIRAQTEAVWILDMNDTLRWRGTLVTAVLRVSKPGKVLTAMQSVQPTVFTGKTKEAAITAIRRMLNETRSKMGLPNLPVSETQKENPKKNRPGKPTDAQLEEYRIAYCLPWLEKNAGEPRLEQLSDMTWDLKPYPPQFGSAQAAEPPAKNPTVAASEQFTLPSPEAAATSPAPKTTPAKPVPSVPAAQPPPPTSAELSQSQLASLPENFNFADLKHLPKEEREKIMFGDTLKRDESGMVVPIKPKNFGSSTEDEIKALRQKTTRKPD